MEKKLLTPEEKQIEWLKNEMEKDKMQLDKEKQEIIESLKHFKKEEIIILLFEYLVYLLAYIQTSGR
jgi:uncharacterized membrane-anchored protein YhcB (DUF1043 family)